MISSFWFAIAVLLTLVLVGFSVKFARPAGQNDGMAPATRFFLVLLRLAIGWHFCIEGLEKLHSATWTSEAYLREATGPLAPQFRWLAGDRLVEQLTVGTDGRFPETLAVEWDAYLGAFQNHFRLDAEQSERAEAIVDQAKKNAVTWLTVRKRSVELTSAVPPALIVSRTIPERLELLDQLEADVRRHEQGATSGPLNVEEWKAARVAVSRWRASLQRDLRLLTKDMKRALQNYILELTAEKLTPDDRKKLAKERDKIAAEARKEKARPDDWEDEDRLKDKAEEKVLAAVRSIVNVHRAKQSASAPEWDKQTLGLLLRVIDRKPAGVDPYDPLPVVVARPLSSWQAIDWSDAVVKYGLTAVGICLLVGLFTRTACVVGAFYLLLFYLAMPALPGWPDSPRAEGHYLFINKNIIEMLALLALATTRSGRWAGLDALLPYLRPAAWSASRRENALEPVSR